MAVLKTVVAVATVAVGKGSKGEWRRRWWWWWRRNSWWRTGIDGGSGGEADMLTWTVR